MDIVPKNCSVFNADPKFSQVLSHYSHFSIAFRQKIHIKHKLGGVVNLDNMIFISIN